MSQATQGQLLTGEVKLIPTSIRVNLALSHILIAKIPLNFIILSQLCPHKIESQREGDTNMHNIGRDV